MTTEEINKLLGEGQFPGDTGRPELVETHISWVIVCDRFVYKIKKPVHYSFLDFSTIEKRKYYCEREVGLNSRLTTGMYLDVQPVILQQGVLSIGGNTGEVVDYAVRMVKANRERQMDVLLLQNKVTPDDITALAEKIAVFHKSAAIISPKNILDIQTEFNDLAGQADYLRQAIGEEQHTAITQAIGISDAFIQSHTQLLIDRCDAGFYRDCHGDLHSRNIFLMPEPQPFDCIEFNDEFRYIDVLNEVAFLCMDLDAFNRRDLAELFINSYNRALPCIRTEEDAKLFIYYKAYRANIRAKVNGLRARTASNSAAATPPLLQAARYLVLMQQYLKAL